MSVHAPVCMCVNVSVVVRVQAYVSVVVCACICVSLVCEMSVCVGQFHFDDGLCL